MNKTGRMGIRVGDLLDWEALVPMVTQVLEHKNALITKIYGGKALKLDDVLAKCRLWAEQMAPYAMATEQLVQDLLAQGKGSYWRAHKATFWTSTTGLTRT